MHFIGDYCDIPIIHSCNEDTARAKVFEIIWDNGHWQSAESKSGPGSTVWYTKNIREFLPYVIKKYNITSLLDSPCGDFNWMRYTRVDENFEYVGVDIVNKAITKLRDDYEENEQYNFYHTDIVVYPPYKSFDLIFSRDTLQHLSNSDRERILKNYENSGSKYLFMTFYTGTWDNTDAETGHTRVLNLMYPPYNFPKPLELIVDKNPSLGNGSWTKNMGFWKLPIKRS